MGHQVPLEDRFTLLHICDLRDLAVALVEKCTMDPDADEYNGEDGQPWNVEPVFSVRTFLFTSYVYVCIKFTLLDCCCCTTLLLPCLSRTAEYLPRPTRLPLTSRVFFSLSLSRKSPSPFA